MLVVNDKTPIGKLAMLLAMTETEEEEKQLKDYINAMPNHHAAVTFISGVTSRISAAYTRSIVNAALSTGVIKKTSSQVHAIIHASLEALESTMPKSPVSSSLKIKIAIVANQHWLAVSSYGFSAFSVYTNHERLGLGMMHL